MINKYIICSIVFEPATSGKTHISQAHLDSLEEDRTLDVEPR